MDYIYTPGIIGIKIQTTTSMAKCISIIRKYNPVSMGEIKSAIELREYVLTSSTIDSPGIRKIRKCYDELEKAGIDAEIYERDELISREIISNLIQSHRQTEKEVRAQVDAEVAGESVDEN